MLSLAVFTLAAESVRSNLDGATESVSSIDGTLTVVVDHADASISAMHFGSNRLELDVHGGIDKGLVLTSSVTKTDSSLTISRLMCTPGIDLPCSNLQVWVNTTLMPAQDSVTMSMSIEGVNVDKDKPTAPWTAPITNTFTFKDAANLKLWAPWDRNGKVDPLKPSDGGYSWWHGVYSFGTALINQDFTVAEHVTFLDPLHNSGVSVIGNPSNPPIPQGFFNTSGTGGAACTTPTSCTGPASFAFSYHMLRVEAGVVHRRSYDLVPHQAACWRPGLAWSVAHYPQFWKPTIGAAAREVDGLGSYSSYLGNLTDPKWKKMGYQTSWDLSGRFFPYMG